MEGMSYTGPIDLTLEVSELSLRKLLTQETLITGEVWQRASFAVFVFLLWTNPPFLKAFSDTDNSGEVLGT